MKSDETYHIKYMETNHMKYISSIELIGLQFEMQKHIPGEVLNQTQLKHREMKYIFNTDTALVMLRLSKHLEDLK